MCLRPCARMWCVSEWDSERGNKKERERDSKGGYEKEKERENWIANAGESEGKNWKVREIDRESTRDKNAKQIKKGLILYGKYFHNDQSLILTKKQE